VTSISAVECRERRNTVFLAAYLIRKLVLHTAEEARVSKEYLQGHKPQSAFIHPKGSPHDLGRYLPREMQDAGAHLGTKLFGELTKKKIVEIDNLVPRLHALFNTILLAGTLVNSDIVEYFHRE